jgi:hypothetical protein
MPFKFGRRRPIVRYPGLHLRNYIRRSLPSPPLTSDYTPAAAAALSEVYLNNSLGDCVIAGMAHVSGILTANSGLPPVLYSDAQITALYSGIGGYVPGDASTDQGCDEQVALAWWENNGMLPDGSHKISGHIAVNSADPVEQRNAIYLFENLVFGLALPDAWVNPFPSTDGFVWDVAGPPNPDNGHCIVSGSYVQGKLGISTWGLKGWITDAAVAKYLAPDAGGELYTTVSEDSINRAMMKAPNGLPWYRIIDYFDSMAWPGVL